MFKSTIKELNRTIVFQFRLWQAVNVDVLFAWQGGYHLDKGSILASKREGQYSQFQEKDELAQSQPNIAPVNMRPADSIV